MKSVFIAVLLLISTIYSKQIHPQTRETLSKLIYNNRDEYISHIKEDITVTGFQIDKITKENICQFPNFFMYRFYLKPTQENYYQFLPFYISLIDYPHEKYTTLFSDASHLGVDTAHFAVKNYLGEIKYNSPEETLIGNIEFTNQIVSLHITTLINILNTYATEDDINFYAKEIYKRVQNGSWGSGQKYYQNFNRIALLSFTNLSHKVRAELLLQTTLIPSAPYWLFERLAGKENIEDYGVPKDLIDEKYKEHVEKIKYQQYVDSLMNARYKK